jgi:beta-glucosidase-like glycosyl hydrolase
MFFLWASSPVTAFAADEMGRNAPFSSFFVQGEKETLKKMDLEEKIGQLLIFGFQGKSLDDDLTGWLSSGKLGNIKIFLRNVESREQVTGLTAEIEGLCAKTGSRVPPFIATDMEGGTVNHVRFAGIALAPAAGLIGATRSVESARVSSRLIALTLAGIGINMNFAPCADVLTEPRNRVIMTRSYGSDPDSVAGMTAAFVREQARLGIFPIMKHFPGHGMTAFDSHLVSEKVDIGKRELERLHILPYKKLIGDKALDGVMTAHIIYSALDPRLPATFSSAIIGGLLRDELGFDGIVVTDELEMEGAQKVSKGIVESFVRAFEAGNDLFLVGHTKDREAELIEELPRLFSGGLLSVEELDRRCLRVLAQKRRYLSGFFRNRGRSENLSDYTLAAEENRKIAQEGIVLLSSRIKGSIPAFLKEAINGKKKGVILAPTEGFARLAKGYLPSWDVVDIGYRLDREENEKRIAASRKKLRSSELALLGFANETHEGWADACIEEKLPFFVLSVDNPFVAGLYGERALFCAACFGPHSPATDALFRSVFVTGEFKGRFPYDR